VSEVNASLFPSKQLTRERERKVSRMLLRGKSGKEKKELSSFYCWEIFSQSLTKLITTLQLLEFPDLVLF